MLASPPSEIAAPRIDDRSPGRHGLASGSPPREHALDSTRLLQGRREVTIRHGGECYRLRHTRSDKLILTK